MWLDFFKRPSERTHNLVRRGLLAFEELESRVVPATWSVTNLASSPATVGSLPWAVAQANQDESQSAVLISIAAPLAGANIPLATTLNFTNTSKTVQVNGPAGGIFVSGGGPASFFSVFQVEAGVTVVLNNIVARNGAASFGAGIANFGTLTLQSCAVINNTARDDPATTTNEFAGAVYNSGTLTAVNSLFSNNSVVAPNGSTSFLFGLGGAIHNAGNMIISTCTFSSNAAFGNSGGGGGAIYNSGTAAITNSVFTLNFSNDGGGAICNNQANLTMTGCTVASNSATNGGGGLLNSSGTATLANCTFTGNAAPGSALGGALYNLAGTLTLINSTIARNSAAGGGGICNNSGSVLLRNTIVALNTAASDPDLDGNNVDPSSSNNLIGVAGGGLVAGINDNLVGVANPLLSNLGSFGGASQTIALLPGSPAIDAGDVNLIPAGTDQRGKIRTYNSVPDIGAFESQGFTLSTTGSGQTAFINNTFAQSLVVNITANNAVEPVNGGKITFTAPATGASATINTPSATIALAKVSVTAKANLTSGDFSVTAAARGATSVQFALANNPVPILNPLSDTSWTVNQSGYSGTIDVTSGTGVYSNLTVTGLPPGLTAELAGGTVTISGTPTQSGTFATINVSLKDTTGATVKATYSITIHAAMTLGGLSKPAWTVDQSYAGTISIGGGTGPFTTTNVTVTGLPDGLSYSVTGTTITVSGTPTQTGTHAVHVDVLDTAGATGSRTYDLTVNAAPTLDILNGPSSWTKGIAYSATIAISGGSGTYSKLIVNGLPVGLTATLLGSTIKITGKATQSGSFPNIAVSVQDVAGVKALGSYALTIGAVPAPSALSTPVWTVNQPNYQGTIQLTGGTAPYSNLTVTGLPIGLNADLVGSVVTFSGTPTQTGTFKTIVVSAKDTTGATIKGTFTLTVKTPPTLGALSRTTWTVNQTNFAGSIAIAAGTGPFTVDSISGLPSGLIYTVTGATLKFSGTPTATGVSTIELDVKDAAGAIVHGSYTLTINAAPTFGSLSKPEWTVNKPYGALIPLSGGTGGYTKLVVSGLPPGLNAVIYGNSIKLAGVPTRAGVFRGLTFALQDAVGTKLRGTFTLTINAAPTLGALSKAAWTLNQPYTGSIVVAGGTGSITLVSATGLPAGLSAVMSDKTLTISGTPSQAGTFKALTVQVQDSAGVIAKKIYTLTIRPAPSLGSLSVASWTVNRPNYVGTVAIAGGSGPFLLTTVSGLPAGLVATLSGATVKIAGKPTDLGTFVISLIVTDATGATATGDFNLAINA